MSKSFTGATSTAIHVGHGKEFNEFARIEGLGPATRRWLREAFSVQTLEDLAHLSINRVLANPDLSRLEAEGKAVCRQKLERWIRQAQEFVAEKTTWRTFATFVVSLQSRQIGGQTEQRTTAYFLEADRSVIWSGIECNGVYEMMLDQLKHTFQLEPEVTIPMEPEEQHESESIAASPPVAEPDALAADTPPTIEPEPVAEQEAAPVDEAIEAAAPFPPLDQIELDFEEPVAAIPEPELEPDQPEPKPAPSRLEITQIKVWQPLEAKPAEFEATGTGKSGTGKAGTGKSRAGKSKTSEPETKSEIRVELSNRMLSNTLKATAPFDLEVTFQLMGEDALELTKHSSPYYSEFYVWDNTTGAFFSFGRSSVGNLKDRELSYTSRLKQAIFQNPGSYRLQVITKLVGSSVSPILFEIPTVQVI